MVFDNVGLGGGGGGGGKGDCYSERQSMPRFRQVVQVRQCTT